MKAIKPEEWTPADGLSLEDNARDVARSTSNALVVAGPGAGKTELLAQRASYLLQTNTCPFPHRILAISFKNDAAHNLKERVKLRCGQDLSKRFDSMTFDAFAKQLLTRFKSGLPVEYQFSNDFDIITANDVVLNIYRVEDINFVSTNDQSKILKFHTDSRLPLPQKTKQDDYRAAVWKDMLKGPHPKLTFQMVMRLAELVIATNPQMKRYLQQTYKYVFLDEFQDTTAVQYDFFKTCFSNSGTVFTAVGDDKQRIMLWAGALAPVFDEFVADTGARRVPLLMNFRSAPQLVKLQNYLVEHLLGKTDFATPSAKWKPNDGACYLWRFKDQESETEILFNTIKQWIEKEGVNPREICILAKQTLGVYTGKMIQYFNVHGIKARDENELQNLLTDEVSLFLINALYTTFQRGNYHAKQAAFSFLSNLHTEFEETQLLRLENSFAWFISKLTAKYNTKKGVLTAPEIVALLDEVVEFAGKDRIKAFYPAYKNDASLRKQIGDFTKAFQDYYTRQKDIVAALTALEGKDTIPVMTVHKSKGLEYHTVIFVGLEDAAFWSFEKQPDEDKCTFFVALSRAKERVVFTFSNTRTDRNGQLKLQKFKVIEVLFNELKNSGIVKIEDKI